MGWADNDFYHARSVSSPHVILSEAKNLGEASEILRFAQNDRPE